MNTIDKSQTLNMINDFVSSFEKHIENIASISIEHNARRYRKILFVSVIEGLAKCRYPTKHPRDRFLKFVHEFGDWSSCDNISLPHLVLSLERTAAKQFDALRDFSFIALSKWETGGPVFIDKDPKISEIQSLWPKVNGSLLSMPCLNIKIQQLRHVELLYEYRNYLVHESRQPTMGFDSEKDRNPFYESEGSYNSTVGNQVSKFNLVYPSGFLCGLSKTCLNNLKNYLITNCKNPFDSFTFGDCLLEQLNDNDSFPVVVPFYKT